MDRLKQQLAEGLATLGLDIDARTQARLLDFIQLLQKWNRTYNLTAVREPGQMVSRHLLDSLAILPDVKGPRVLDIGTGAGLPGVPLALVRPDLRFVLLDANAKKTRFVTQAIGELGIANAEAVQARVEKYRPQEKFDTLISRAFGSIADMLASAGHLSAAGGEFLAMKGVYPEEELTTMPADYEVKAVRNLAVPGLDAARHLVVLARR